MAETKRDQNWLNRRPRSGDTCVFTHGYSGITQYHTNLVSDWKRDALLFDRVYASCLDPNNPPDIPIELSFGIAGRDRDAQSHYETMARMVAEAYPPHTSPDEMEKIDPGIVQEFDFDRKLSQLYSDVGVMGEWTYSNKGLYVRRFTQGEQIAYEGTLNNIPIMSAANVSWDQIIDFRNDPDASRKYRDLRLWLRTGLGADSVQHATDIIGQKIENYRWAIKKHGFQTSLGALNQLFDWKESGLALAAGGVGGVFGGPVGAGIASGLVIVAKIGAFLCERKLASSEILRGPDRAVAILYDAQERFT